MFLLRKIEEETFYENRDIFSVLIDGSDPGFKQETGENMGFCSVWNTGIDAGRIYVGDIGRKIFMGDTPLGDSSRGRIAFGRKDVRWKYRSGRRLVFCGKRSFVGNLGEFDHVLYRGTAVRDIWIDNIHMEVGPHRKECRKSDHSPSSFCGNSRYCDGSGREAVKRWEQERKTGSYKKDYGENI